MLPASGQAAVSRLPMNYMNLPHPLQCWMNPRLHAAAMAFAFGCSAVLAQNGFIVSNLVSDLPGLAAHTDTNLVNPWGIATSASSPFWLSDNHTGLSSLYVNDGTPQALLVSVPGPGGAGVGAPTGIIFNSTTNFSVTSGAATAPAKFIFATEDGTIAAWYTGASATIVADQSGSGAVYKGLAAGSWGGQSYLYAANFHAGTVDVFDGSFHPVTWTGAFTDPAIPAGFAPFNIQNFGGILYVTYAKQDADAHDDVSGPGNGFIDVYTQGGGFVKRFASNGVLNSPWGLAIAPSAFGEIGGALLVGNFGDGNIHAFDVVSGAVRGALATPTSEPVQVRGLWGLIGGNGGKGGDTNKIYFAAGIPGDGAVEDHGLFGSIAAATSVVVGENKYLQTNLVSDIPGMAAHTDTNLVNPWGIVSSATSPFWVSDNHSGFSSVYVTDGTPQSLLVGIPGPGGSGVGAPTGIIFNSSTNFAITVGTNQVAAKFIFATEDGTIAAWASGAAAVLAADRSADGAVYKGLAVGSWGGNGYLYATDFHNGAVDIYDGQFHLTNWPGAFSDVTIPTGFAPFNIQNLGGLLYVTYAKQDADAHDDVSGPGNGFINVYTQGGDFIKRFATQGVLNSPWGLAVAPKSFGALGGSLLVGNFGDGWINAFDPVTGASLAPVSDSVGQPVEIPGLWGLIFGNGSKGGNTNTLYFTAGIPGDGAVEDHGLFGGISTVVPVIRLLPPVLGAGGLTLSWQGGIPPYRVQFKTDLTSTTWSDVSSTTNGSLTVTTATDQAFYRVTTD